MIRLSFAVRGDGLTAYASTKDQFGNIFDYGDVIDPTPEGMRAFLEVAEKKLQRAKNKEAERRKLSGTM